MKRPKDNTRKRRSALVAERDKLKLLHMTSVRETTFSSIDFSAINKIELLQKMLPHDIALIN